MAVTLALGPLGPSNEAADKTSTEARFFLHATESPDTSLEWSAAGPMLTLVDHSAPISLEYLGGSPDFCHLFLDEGIDISLTSGPTVLLEQAENGAFQLYEVTRGCEGEPAALHLVAVNDSGKLISPSCRADLGLEHFRGLHKEVRDSFNAVAADGEMAFFTTCINNVESDHQLFVRLAGSRTLEVSKPMGEKCGEYEIPCAEAKERPSADFEGASEDGSKVFFTTSAQLTSEDSDEGNDLYMAEIGCSVGENCGVTERRVTRLIQVSHDPNGGEADVQGVLRIAPDGSRVYFVARGDLLSAGARSTLESKDRSVPGIGADNLYAYDISGGIEFVASLCSGHNVSGQVEDRHCPSVNGQREPDMWELTNGNDLFAQTAGADGRYLVFTSYGQLTIDDTDTAKDVYRFDAVTGLLKRVSIGENGYDENGNNDEFDATILPGVFGGTVLRQYEMEKRAISEDGSRIVFSTAEPLSPAAINHLTNVYEWHENANGEGEVSLLSDGSGPSAVEDAVIAPSGTDVFFVTSQGLVPQDVDGEPYVYDARFGGGFPSTPAAQEPCSGDACQGPLTIPAPLLVPSSISQVPGENLAPPAKNLSHPKVRKKHKPPKKKKSRGHRAAKGSKVHSSVGRLRRSK
jgi:hypothetical protein